MTTTSRQLANYCIQFYNALRGTSRRASSRAQYQQLLQRGYSSVAGGQPTVARGFLDMVCVSSWDDLDDGARQFSSQAGLGEDAHLGARDFMGVSWQTARLDQRIRGNGLGQNAPIADPIAGFASLNGQQRGHADVLAGSWEITALQVTRHADFSRVLASMKSFYRIQIRAAKVFYNAALYSPTQIPHTAQIHYYPYLHAHHHDIWGSYKVALFPTQQQMAERLSMSILAGHNPYSNTPPPTHAAEAMLGTLWQGLSGT